MLSKCFLLFSHDKKLKPEEQGCDPGVPGRTGESDSQQWALMAPLLPICPGEAATDDPELSMPEELSLGKALSEALFLQGGRAVPSFPCKEE